MAWRHFTIDEFKCKCGCDGNQIDQRLVDLLDQFREDLRFPLVVSSGYRCPAHNEEVSPGTGRRGPHTTGKAVDIQIMGMDAYLLLQRALNSGKVYGIGLQQKGPHSKRFVHLDVLTSTDSFRPTVWTY